MKVVGLITEYNPFHNGHRFHIDEAKRKTGADFVIVVMSGNFVQRGAPALLDKYSRTQMALNNGADVVFELPVCYATASAEYFALGAVSLLDKLGIVDFICFGSECGELAPLMDAVDILLEEPQEFRDILNAFIKKGLTFPAARMEALKFLLKTTDEAILSSPNNILGIEYIKALKKLKSSIQPVTITRIKADYHSNDLSAATTSAISSATAIRKTVSEIKPLSTLVNHIPETVYQIMEHNYQATFPIFDDDFSLLLKYKLMQETEISLLEYLDMTPDLANRIRQTDLQGLSYTQIAQEIKTRQWTLTRINRVLLHILLNLYTDDIKLYKNNDYIQYARILGFKKNSSHLIKNIKKLEKIPVITKTADAYKHLSTTGFSMLQQDIFASHLYNQVIFNKFGSKIPDEYTHGIIIL